jgi:hypothetical protein
MEYDIQNYIDMAYDEWLKSVPHQMYDQPFPHDKVVSAIRNIIQNRYDTLKQMEDLRKQGKPTGLLHFVCPGLSDIYYAGISKVKQDAENIMLSPHPKKRKFTSI